MAVTRKMLDKACEAYYATRGSYREADTEDLLRAVLVKAFEGHVLVPIWPTHETQAAMRKAFTSAGWLGSLNDDPFVAAYLAATSP